jgi:RNA polymerase sigma-70 factor, ECF subfamily
MPPNTKQATDLSITLRPKLLRLCTRMLFDTTAAEDVVQEALLLAWQKRERGEQIADWGTYTLGIARTLCKNQQRKIAHRRESDLGEIAETLPAIGSESDPLEEMLIGERGTLLEMAFCRLDADSQRLLHQRYISERPVNALAKDNGITENAMTLRLSRAKESLRKILTTELRETAAAYGLLTEDEAAGWQETDIYCPRCGKTRMHGRWEPSFNLKCPHCDGNTNGLLGLSTSARPVPAAQLVREGGGWRVSARRVNNWWDNYTTDGMKKQTVACIHCGKNANVATAWPESNAPGFTSLCTHCKKRFYIHPAGLVLHSKEGFDFWRQHERIQHLRPRKIEYQGHDAIVVGFAACKTNARLEVIYTKNGLQRLG